MRRPFLSAFAALGFLLAACSSGGTTGGSDGATANTAVLASSFQAGTVGTGPQRVLLALIGDDGSLLNAAGLAVTAEFAKGGVTKGSVGTRFVETVPGSRGLYVARFAFDEAGTWELVLLPEGMPPTPPSPFVVVDDPTVPEVGEPAPRSKSPTGDEFPLSEISSDPDPEPSFYALSLDEALTDGRPTVAVFATPAFCQTATCGPVLDIAKRVARTHPAADFVHVEVYRDLQKAAEGELIPAPAILEWGFPSEPWVYVTDADGVVRARFEGSVSPAELEEALAAVGA